MLDYRTKKVPLWLEISFAFLTCLAIWLIKCVSLFYSLNQTCMVWFRWWLWCSGRSPLCFLVRPHKLLTKPFKQPDPQIVSDIHFLYTVVCEFFFPKVLEIRLFFVCFLMVHLLPWAPDGAHILWQHNTETDTLSLSLLCACEQSQKKSMKPLTFVSWDLVFCLSLSLLQLPTCLACLQCHHMVQILTLGKISPKPFYLLPTANTYMCDTTNSICLMVEYSLTFIIKTLQHWLCYMYSWILQIRSWNVSE